jgi:DNA polymerase-3 subunit delta'
MLTSKHPRYTQNLIGHQDTWRTMVDLYTHQNIHPCWLLNGQRGIGKATFCYQLARYILTKNPQNPFGLAEAIVRPQINNESYSNLLVMEPIVDEDGKVAAEITIDQARALKKFLMQKPSIPGWRIVIIDAVDELNRSASNALLKVLEEPPAQTLILLVCHSLGRVLPTIRSRCQRITMNPLHEECFEGLPPNMIEIAQGSLGIINTLKNHGANDLVTQLSTVVDCAFQNNFSKIKPMLETLAKQTISMDIIFWIILQHIYKKTQSFEAHTEHWLDVWEKMNKFLMLVKSTHLDRLHTLTMCCVIIQNPNQNLQI